MRIRAYINAYRVEMKLGHKPQHLTKSLKFTGSNTHEFVNVIYPLQYFWNHETIEKKYIIYTVYFNIPVVTIFLEMSKNFHT